MRKFTVMGNLSYESLYQHIRDIYRVSRHELLVIKYCDEDREWISITSEDELSEAVFGAPIKPTVGNDMCKFLRLFACSSASEQPPIPEQSDYGQNSTLADVLNSSVTPSVSSPVGTSFTGPTTAAPLVLRPSQWSASPPKSALHTSNTAETSSVFFDGDAADAAAERESGGLTWPTTLDSLITNSSFDLPTNDAVTSATVAVEDNYPNNILSATGKGAPPHLPTRKSSRSTRQVSDMKTDKHRRSQINRSSRSNSSSSSLGSGNTPPKSPETSSSSSASDPDLPHMTGDDDLSSEQLLFLAQLMGQLGQVGFPAASNPVVNGKPPSNKSQPSQQNAVVTARARKSVTMKQPSMGTRTFSQVSTASSLWTDLTEEEQVLQNIRHLISPLPGSDANDSDEEENEDEEEREQEREADQHGENPLDDNTAEEEEEEEEGDTETEKLDPDELETLQRVLSSNLDDQNEYEHDEEGNDPLVGVDDDSEVDSIE